MEEKLEMDNEKEDWSLNIEAVSNGYILRGRAETGVPYAEVIEDSEVDMLKSGEALLFEIMEYFNFGGSKHDKERLQIVRKKYK